MAQTPQRGVPAGRNGEPAPPKDESDADRQRRANAEEAAARASAEAQTAHLPQPGSPPQEPAAATPAPGEATVKMTFAQPVTLTLPGYRIVRFAAGIQDVPESLADDDYLKASGATRI